MDPSIILDYLISQNNGDTLYIDQWDRPCVQKLFCPNSLLLEVILRGFQIKSQIEIHVFGAGDIFGCGDGSERGLIYIMGVLEKGRVRVVDLVGEEKEVEMEKDQPQLQEYPI